MGKSDPRRAVTDALKLSKELLRQRAAIVAMYSFIELIRSQEWDIESFACARNNCGRQPTSRRIQVLCNEREYDCGIVNRPIDANEWKLDGSRGGRSEQWEKFSNGRMLANLIAIRIGQ